MAQGNAAVNNFPGEGIIQFGTTEAQNFPVYLLLSSGRMRILLRHDHAGSHHSTALITNERRDTYIKQAKVLPSHNDW